MIGFDRPDEGAAFVITVIVISVLLVRIYIWLRDSETTPDPWDANVQQQIDSPETELLCHRCLTPHQELTQFCPHCGAAIGQYNNVLPFEYVFSEGDVFRNGTTLRLNAVRLMAYFFVSFVAFALMAPLILVLPFYWALLLRNYFSQRDEPLMNVSDSSAA